MDASTALEALARGNPDVFIPIAEDETIPEPSGVVVQWDQADYFALANALHEFAWGESLEGWQFYQAMFRLQCDQVARGPQFALLEFYKSVLVGDGSKRIHHLIDIAPEDNRAYFTEFEYYPELISWPSIDLSDVKVTAEEALQIAEANGGAVFREQLDDKCSVYMYLRSDEIRDGWYVDYSVSERKFSVLVNENTGEFTVVEE